MINKVILLGQVKSQPQERGAAVQFRMTTWRNHHDGRRFDTTHTVEIFGKSKDLAIQLREGDTIAVEGSIKHSSYEKNGQKVWFTSVNATSLSRVGADESQQQSAPTQTHSAPTQSSSGSAPSEYPPNQANNQAGDDVGW